MFGKVRNKFILVAVCSVSLVLFCILGAINIINYAGIVSEADEIIVELQKEDWDLDGMRGHNFSQETLSSARYFTVTIDAAGIVTDIDVSRTLSVSAEEAIHIAYELRADNKASGFYGSYRYGVSILRANARIYLFVDCTTELKSFYDFLWVSIIIGTAGIVVVFILIFIFSGRILKPVAESYRKQKQFITDAGHEIKTPITIIGANTEVIEMQSGQSEWTTGIKEQILRLSSLTEKLIFLTKMEEQANIPMYEFSLTDAVNESARSFAAVAASRDIRLQIDAQMGISYKGNEDMIRQLVSLLTDNALKYTDGDAVTVSLHTEGGKCILEACNRASYMQDGSLSGLFERFVRRDTSRNSKTGGHGIGLSVVRAIVDAHKGKIKTECRQGNVIFTIIL